MILAYGSSIGRATSHVLSCAEGLTLSPGLLLSISMPHYTISGGTPLRGTVITQGSKNALFPIMSAAILFDAPIIIHNVPDIRDAHAMLEIFTSLGGKITKLDKASIKIEPSDYATSIEPELARKLRGCLVLLGSLLGRYGEAFLPMPGGDLIGPRPIDQHLKGFRLMGADVNEDRHGYRVHGSLYGADVYLEKATVTGTENLLLAAVMAKGVTIIRHAAQEPHVTALAELLIKGGAKISGVGTHTLIVEGRDGKLFTESQEIDLIPDELDAGTFAIAAILTNGDITINPYPAETLRPLTEKLQELGGKIEIGQKTGSARITRATDLKPFELLVGYAPAYPSDLQAPIAILATQAVGTSTIHDWLYEGRFGYVEDLRRMGAHIEVFDPHRIQITGPTKLAGRKIMSPDIRAGMAYILAALVAEGESVIDHADIVERGYEHLGERLKTLGAHIERTE